MRMGGYRTDDPVLRFQVAVPAALAHSARALPYVLAVLEDVLDNARDYFDELRIAFDHGGWQRLLSAAARVEADPPESAWEELPLA
jgi:ABC-type Fe3+ transport system permease subunit